MPTALLAKAGGRGGKARSMMPYGPEGGALDDPPPPAYADVEKGDDLGFDHVITTKGKAVCAASPNTPSAASAAALCMGHI